VGGTGGILNTDSNDLNRARFEALYNGNKEDLYIYLHRSVRDPDLAADILQDAFYNFFHYFKNKEVPEDTISRKYLYRTARNLVINHYNKSSTRQESALFSEDTVKDGHSANVEDYITDKLHRESQEEMLQAALQTLPEKQRSAIILKYYHDFKLEEISQILDTSVSSVSRMVNQGIEKLTNKFESEKKNEKKDVPLVYIVGD
jgi:RNA polymerase sigma-70 factor, ECF subfamily